MNLKRLCAALLAALLAGCSGDDGVVGTGVDPGGVKIKVIGAVQKGPFVIGSRVTIGRLLEAGAQSSTDAVITTTQNDLGDFTVELDSAGSFEILADGYHFNELTGGLSQGTLMLRAVYFADPGSNRKADVNLLTHLIHGRILFLIRGGSSPAVAEAQARGELLAALTPVFHVEQLPEFTSLSLYNVDTVSEIGNAYLLALSATAYKYAMTRASANGSSVDAELTLLINSLADDFTKDGTIDAAETVAALINSSRLLDPVSITNNLRKRSVQAVGEELPVPDINQFLDTDGDGQVNVADDDDDNDTAPDSIDPFPYGGDSIAIVNAVDKYRGFGFDTPLTAEFTNQSLIAKVEYLLERDGSVIGSAITPPYRVDWNPYFWMDYETTEQFVVRVTSHSGATYMFDISVETDGRLAEALGGFPGPEAIVRHTNRPVFQWLSIPGAVQYEVQVTTLGSQFLLWAQTTIDTTIEAPESGSGLAANWILVWSVRAADTHGNWGALRQFYEFRIRGPEPPTLLAPLPSALVLPGTPIEFSWAPAEFAAEYELVVHSIGNGGFHLIRTTSTRESLVLEPGAYTWSVISTNHDGVVGERSEVLELGVGIFKSILSGSHANAIREALGGGLIVAGDGDFTGPTSATTTDALLTKLDGTGATEWTATLTPPDDYSDTAFDVMPTSDGGYLVTGSTLSLNNHVAPDLYLMKTDASGVQQWVELYSGVCPCSGAEVKLTEFGAIVMARSADGNFIVGVDALGATLWSRTVSASQIAAGARPANSVALTTDGGYALFGGYTGVASSQFPYVEKFGANGKTEWTATTGAGRFTDIASGFQTLDGGYIVVGKDTLPSTSLLKVNAQGVVSWLRSVVEPFNLSSQATFIPAHSVPLVELPDGSFILFSNHHTPFDSAVHASLLRLDSTGVIQTHADYGDFGTPVALIRTSDGGFVMLSNDVDPDTGRNTRPIIVKTSADGSTVGAAYQ